MIKQTAPRKASKSYTPSPETIAKACAQIQANWSETERRKRQVSRAAPFAIPEFNVSELGLLIRNRDAA